MEVTTFADDEVKTVTADWQLLQIDMTDNTTAHRALLKELKVFGPPTILFFDAADKEYSQHRLVGSISAEAFVKHITSLSK